MTNRAAAARRKVTFDLEAGEPKAISRLTRAVRAIHGTRDPDLEQEAFVRALKAFRREGDVAFPNALMWKVVRDTVADHWRRQLRKRTEQLDKVPEHRLAHQPDMDQRIDRERELERLHHALFSLGYDSRGPMYLFYVEGYSIPKIAKLSDKTVAAVKTAIWRGRKKVAQTLQVSMSSEQPAKKSRQGRILPD
jgi:RNA polymerase sigma-70 factor (ECF subfamily)